MTWPYKVKQVFDNGYVKIKTIDDGVVTLLVNWHIIKLYQKPKSMEEFLNGFLEQSDLEIVDGGPIHPFFYSYIIYTSNKNERIFFLLVLTKL